MKKNLLLSLTISGFLFSQTSTAGEWSVGGLVGQSSFNDIDTICDSFISCNSDDTDTGFGINIAYNFNKTWGVEAGYIDLGTFSATPTFSGVSSLVAIDSGAIQSFVAAPDSLSIVSLPVNTEIDTSALYLAGTASHYLNNQWSITGRLGVAEVDADLSVTTQGFSFGDFNIPSATTRDSVSETEVYYGVSINYDFYNRFQAQLRYDDVDVDLISFGIKYSFGK